MSEMHLTPQPVGEGLRERLHSTLQRLFRQRLIGRVRKIGRGRQQSDPAPVQRRGPSHPVRVSGAAGAEIDGVRSAHRASPLSGRRAPCATRAPGRDSRAAPAAPRSLSDCRSAPGAAWCRPARRRCGFPARPAAPPPSARRPSACCCRRLQQPRRRRRGRIASRGASYDRRASELPPASGARISASPATATGCKGSRPGCRRSGSS